MLHHHDRIAQGLQLAQDPDQLVRIARMEADAGLVEDVERTDQAAAQGGGNVDALALTTGEGGGEAVERQIAQPHIQQELQPAVDFRQQPFGHLPVCLVEGELVEEGLGLGNGHGHDLGDVLAAHLYIEGLRFQTASLAGGAGGLAPVAGHHDPILDLVLVLSHKPEEVVNAMQPLGSMPKQLLFGLRKLEVGAMDREVVPLALLDETGFPFAHHLPFPADDCPFVQREALVRNDQMLVNAQHLAEPFTGGAGTQRIVEAEHHFRRLFKLDAVRLEPFGIVPSFGSLRQVEAEGTGIVTLVKGGLGRIGQTGLETLLVGDGQPIDQQFNPFGLVGLQEGESLVDPVGLPIDLHPGEALLLQEVQLFRKGPSLRQLDGSQEGEAGAYGVGKHIPHNVGHLMLLHLLARDGGDGLPDAGKEQTQILVNFG